MKRIMLIVTISVAAMLIGGCDYYCPSCHSSHQDDYYYYDYSPPTTPYDVHSITHDGYVYLYWHPVWTADFYEYRVYRGYSETGYYEFIGATRSACFTDDDVTNGITYYYAISSVDYSGNESDLSDDLVFDTPRPEGYGVTLWAAEYYPDDAGMDFSEYLIVAYDDPSADIFFGWDGDMGIYYLQAANSATDILDYGYTYSLEDVDYAPESGWAPEGWVRAYESHSYVIWTADNHFAQIRITRLGANYITLDWAYQTDRGNPELMVTRPKPEAMTRKTLKTRIITRRIENDDAKLRRADQ